jgi:hypothetical protein
MMADGLTKALRKQPFNHFIDLIGIENLYDRLEAIQKEDELLSKKLNISTIAFLAYDETWDAREIRSAIYDRAIEIATP